MAFQITFLIVRRLLELLRLGPTPDEKDVDIEPLISAFRCSESSVPEMALDQVFCGARWNRTIGLSIISAD